MGPKAVGQWSWEILSNYAYVQKADTGRIELDEFAPAYDVIHRAKPSADADEDAEEIVEPAENEHITLPESIKPIWIETDEDVE